MDNTKIRDSIFFLIVFSLIFVMIPKYLQMDLLGGPLRDKLVFYPLVLGFIYTAYCHYCYKNILVEFTIIKKYILLYCFVLLGSLLLGLYNYPYYDLITNGPLGQIEKLPKIIKIFELFNITIDIKVATIIWLIVRNVKAVVLEAFYIFGGAYMIFCWYRKNWEQGFKVCCLGVLASLVVIFGYSFIEVFYLAGNEWAKDILIKITPYFLTIANNNSAWGWPPVLWFQPQLRSVFAEPSYFGLYAAFCVPFLWYLVAKNDFNTKCSYVYLIINYVMTFFLFLTKARTGVALIVGELLLLIFAVCYLKDKEFFKKFLAIIVCTVIAFINSNVFISNFMIKKVIIPKKDVASVSVNSQKSTSSTKVLKKDVASVSVNSQKDTSSIDVLKSDASKYLDSNLKSIFSSNQRSNTPRYAYAKAAIKTGMNNPLLGVGRGLTTAYMSKNFTTQELKNREIKLRIKRMNELGVLYAPIPILNEYAQRFSETGIVGLILFFLPVSFLLRRLITILKGSYNYVFFMISLIGVMASGFSTIFAVTYCYPVLLGLGFAMCFGEVNKLDNEVINK